MAKNKINTNVITKVSYPVPTVHAFNANDDVANIGL
jgi:hypothetical protein